MIPVAQKSVQQRCDSRLNLALMILWGLVLWRVGLVALGYAILAFIGDVQTVLGAPLPDTLQTRHPDGLIVDFTVADLREAWWIAPHLNRAEQFFVLGAAGSLLFYMLKELIMLRHKVRHDPALDARLNRVIDSVEAALTKRLPAILSRIITWTHTLTTRRLRAAWRRPIPDLAESPHAPEQTTVDPLINVVIDTADGAADMPSSDGPELASTEPLIEASAAAHTRPDNEADEVPPSPPTSPPYPNTFFTRF